MKTRLTPHYLDLVYDACLNSFWRKKALGKFLRQCVVPEAALSSWMPDETKRDFLDRLFVQLPRSTEGQMTLVRLAKALMEQQSFPDLQNWEDSAQKTRLAAESVSKLRDYHARQEEEIQSEERRQKAREEFRMRQEEITKSQASLSELSDRLTELAKDVGSQSAGYQFQDWFFDLLDFSEIVNRKPYVHGGRQIDGSLTLSGTTYLVELKFTTEQAGATDIDSFYKKVVTKADNTMGIMASIAGYSSVAKQEASSEGTPLLLLDHSHIYLALGGLMGMADIINRVRRHASQTGEAYLPAPSFTS